IPLGTNPRRPKVSFVNPSSGPEHGGTTVTVMGSGFSGASAVTFTEPGLAPVDGTDLTVISDGKLTVTTPAQNRGAADVQVTTSEGTSVPSGGSVFTYLDTTAPGPVTDPSAVATTTAIRLAWTNPSDGDFAGVVIRRAVGTVAPGS